MANLAANSVFAAKTDNFLKVLATTSVTSFFLHIFVQLQRVQEPSEEFERG